MNDLKLIEEWLFGFILYSKALRHKLLIQLKARSHSLSFTCLPRPLVKAEGMGCGRRQRGATLLILVEGALLSAPGFFTADKLCYNLVLLRVSLYVRPYVWALANLIHPCSVELCHDAVRAIDVEVLLAAEDVVDTLPLRVPEFAILCSVLVTLGLRDIHRLNDPVSFVVFEPVLNCDRSSLDHILFQFQFILYLSNQSF